MQKKTFQKDRPWTYLFKGMLNLILHFFKPLILPLLLAVFPPLFHYGNNAAILLLSSLIRMLMFYWALAIMLYIIFLMFSRRRPTQAANATFVFLIFFNIYGAAYDYFLKLDIFQVEHYSLLPFFVLLAVYASWLITRIKAAYSIRFWNSMVFILGVLVIFNLIKIIPVEIKKGGKPTTNAPIAVDTNLSVDHGYPDIYYVIFDEFSGFEPMREYWHNQEVDDFVQFLKSKGFFVAEQSHGSSIDTLHLMATWLNYQEYSLNAPDPWKIWFDDIADNRAMRYLKSQGYTTVLFDETKFAYPSAPSIKADYSFNYVQSSAIDLGFLFDEFGIMTADNTMLRAFSKLYKLNNPAIAQHRNMIFFTVVKVADLNEVPSPKFVYVHLMLPHFPFMFTENGNLVDPTFYYNWNYYLGNYKFATHIAEKMVDNILSQADPTRPPIIILQSDHGARNLKAESPGSVILENYPEEFKTSILFALYVPGYDTSALPQNIDPINTFPIVFNYLFDANIPLK
jgi:hypothetical protein